MRRRRRQAISAEQKSWTERAAKARAEIGSHEQRLEEAESQRRELDEAPALLFHQRRSLTQQVAAAEAARNAAADARTEAEAAQHQAERMAREALDAMSQSREARARSETQAEALRQRLAEIVRAIETELGCEPAGLPTLAGTTPDAALPPSTEIEQTLEGLRQDRDRLGAVNLRAEEELAEIEHQHGGLAAERDDLTEAVKRLRQAIQNLNREGRERLTAAFQQVNGHFKELFTTLFGGGTAELQLVEAEDPLEAGLEILARPPGKKPATMTLLSGGEQALTAMALIFAVFLTNPSPICVLDEVDAPLDDANVERFCDLLDAMAKRTDTRFLTITHNPITMARMDRLFGVTMAERGVSQLVSVDLATAEGFREAG
jgi:chromosome segregation protein